MRNNNPWTKATPGEYAAKKEYELRQFEAYWMNAAKELCEHGFKRQPGSPWDCHECRKAT